QVRKKALNSRNDLYSLKTTLYETPTGKTPFDGENQFDIMQQQISKPPPSLSSQDVEIPSALERVLKNALEKDPNKRFVDAKSFREALEGLQFDGGEGTRAEKRSAKLSTSKRRVRAVALGLGIG